MSQEYVEVEGISFSLEELKITKAQELVEAVRVNPYANMVECRLCADSAEILVIDVEIELGQRTVHDIRRFERIAVKFDASDNSLPEVLALRSDFPHVPHLNIQPVEFPRSLCIFEENYNEIKLRWTGLMFLERIREWFALTAKGELHEEDQPLEPLLPYTLSHLILPSDILQQSYEPKLLALNREPVPSGPGRLTLITEYVTDAEITKGQFEFIAIVILSKPQVHGIIYTLPRNLWTLHEFLQHGEMNILDLIRENLKTWGSINEKILNSKLILVVILPKRRSESTEIEDYELRTFMLHSTIKETGIEIGIWDEVNGRIGILLVTDFDKNGKDVAVTPLNANFSFSRDMALRLSGLTTQNAPKITAVGLGALGSQVFMNLIRMGYGQWILIDNDFLLPHNLGRHTLTSEFIGFPKALSLALVATQILNDETAAKGIVDNVLEPVQAEKLEAAYTDVDIILDVTASIPVARHLTHGVDSTARRISIFLNPLGTDVVILAEDRNRDWTLDILEMQYYRALIQEPRLENHLYRNQERIRYANSCRDVSTTLPQDLVALQSAVCARALRQVISEEHASVFIWQTDTESFTQKKYQVSVAQPLKKKLGEWTLCTDTWLLQKIYKARAQKLPNETGGILIGAYDMQRRIVYAVDTVLSPPDSQEWPTVYIRGYKGLKLDLNRINAVTAGQLQYVGEWHSHPPGCNANPSADDQKAFTWLSGVMNEKGLPALMLIAGDNNQYAFYLGEMKCYPDRA